MLSILLGRKVTPRLIFPCNMEHSDHTKVSEVLSAAKDVRSVTLAERTALIVSRTGLQFEKSVREHSTVDSRFGFLRSSSDKFYPYYQRMLARYSKENKTEYVTEMEQCGKDLNIETRNLPEAPKVIHLPDHLAFRLPIGTTLDSLDIVRVTAQFVVFYGTSTFLEPLVERLKINPQPGLEFTHDKNDINFDIFCELVRGYFKVLRVPSDLPEKLRKSVAYRNFVLDCYLERIKWNSTQEQKWYLGGEKALLDWHNNLDQTFVKKRPADRQGVEGPDPKRQRVDKSALVPENQFLAKHPGCSTIKVSVRKVIEIRVPSLSENVASLKEKIAGQIHIPAEKQKLSGKAAGCLEDDHMSLAHYNVEPEEILTLSFGEPGF